MFRWENKCKKSVFLDKNLNSINLQITFVVYSSYNDNRTKITKTCKIGNLSLPKTEKKYWKNNLVSNNYLVKYYGCKFNE